MDESSPHTKLSLKKGEEMKSPFSQEMSKTMLKRSMEFDFASVSDSYYDGDFIKKVWDFLRASQTESRELVSEDDPFATNRTSLRLNKLRKLIPEMQHIDHTTDDEDDYAPEPSSSIFHRLMELNRPGEEIPRK